MRPRSLALALALCLLVGCASHLPAETPQGTPEEGTGLIQAAQAVLDSQEDGEDYAPLSPEDREFYLTEVYGLPEGSWTEAALYRAGDADPREVAVLCPGEGRMEDLTAALESYRRDRAGDFFGYQPISYAWVEQGGVYAGESLAALLICSQPESALEALTKAAGGRVTRYEAKPVPVPTEAPRPTPEPTPSEQVLNPDLDISGFVPFAPPGEFDMSLYDDTAVLLAWESGDASFLGEKDLAIYERCREVFAQWVREDMEDWEKELALHDWLVTHCAYDPLAHTPSSPLGQEDNDTPYGPLMGGYGICLGYAETFRLFMDLAGIRCITVAGAAYGSEADHAWNMVRLDGVWYNVDCTWDDPVAGDDDPVRSGYENYRYFNITSQRLVDTDHQWDYRNTPWADTAWEGVTPQRPQ